VFPDDLLILSDRITKRQLDKVIMDYRLISNPHLEEKEAKKLAEELYEKRQKLWGHEINYEPLDIEGFNAWRDEMKKDSISITAK
jgi:hypothetical protein